MCVSDVLRNYFKEINEAILWRPDSGELGNCPVFSSFCFPAELLFDTHSLTPQKIAKMSFRIMSVFIEWEMRVWVPQIFFLQQAMQILFKITIYWLYPFYAFSFHPIVLGFYLDVPVLPGKLAYLPASGMWLGHSPHFRYGHVTLTQYYFIPFITVMGFRIFILSWPNNHQPQDY